MHRAPAMHTVREAVQVQRRIDAGPLNLCVNPSLKSSLDVLPS
jgi:hypothetical protein